MAPPPAMSRGARYAANQFRSCGGRFRVAGRSRGVSRPFPETGKRNFAPRQHLPGAARATLSCAPAMACTRRWAWTAPTSIRPASAGRPISCQRRQWADVHRELRESFPNGFAGRAAHGGLMTNVGRAITSSGPASYVQRWTAGF
jgi:hypothetical protein